MTGAMSTQALSSFLPININQNCGYKEERMVCNDYIDTS